MSLPNTQPRKFADFVASRTRIAHFKHLDNIWSRKATKRVSKEPVDEKQTIDERAEEFVERTQNSIHKYELHEILNSVQGRLELETLASRTLSN
ncbi:unnamed protein product [Didymodactylos carnosus]|uniref:Uncharacterized protein n=1 Tax=Didymodactylos carnosus TaxID=1234261 RepID=A0A815G921_9BILA|nr:unnamed protein product [Didymodactylos carnosus]CAF1603292.1 unnamed protein product [Didymodactylos carnosus]CAF4192430.1 unnamed protein product [Didymodactylos carnosus]CAF4413068.1 unnamed protein product [Didymodactylos carnosus]